MFWHHFGHHGAGDRPFTAHTHGDQKPKDDHVPGLGGERRDAGEDGVKQDRDDHGLRAADLVAHDAKHHAAEGASQKERRQRDIVPSGHQWIVRRFDAQQVRHRVAHAGDKDLPLENVEHPAQGTNDEDQPLVARDAAVPGQF
jgi:hypothetical protein